MAQTVWYEVRVQDMADEWVPIDGDQYTFPAAAFTRAADFGDEAHVFEVVDGVPEPIC